MAFMQRASPLERGSRCTAVICKRVPKPASPRAAPSWHRGRCAAAHVAAAAAAAQADAAAAAAFESLAAQAGVETTRVALGGSGGPAGRALVATRDAERGDVLLAVPRSACIIVDYASDQGMSVPRGNWPRLQQGANFREPLTWDLLQALALMDAAAGDGGEFWGAYADALLPAPEGLTLPLCWEEPLLAELQHGAIAAAARAQQERLRGLFPGLARSSTPGVPSWLQWGFACVRSRAFKVGEEAWASIPFLDMANHAPDPNADFLGDIGRRRDGGGNGAEPYRLVALRDIRAGEEVTISYSGPEGYTNQRFMAQYGFVPRDGNAADRLPLELPAGATMSLDRIEDVLGDALLMDAAQGRNPYLFAALKSLPLQAATDPSTAAANTSGKGLAAEEAALAAQLLAQLEAAAPEGAGTSLTEDEETLSRLENASSNGTGEGPDCRMAAAVRYRLERKRLLQAGRVVLAAYARGSAAAAGPAAAA